MPYLPYLLVFTAVNDLASQCNEARKKVTVTETGNLVNIQTLLYIDSIEQATNWN